MVCHSKGRGSSLADLYLAYKVRHVYKVLRCFFNRIYFFHIYSHFVLCIFSGTCTALAPPCTAPHCTAPYYTASYYAALIETAPTLHLHCTYTAPTLHLHYTARRPAGHMATLFLVINGTSWLVPDRVFSSTRSTNAPYIAKHLKRGPV